MRHGRLLGLLQLQELRRHEALDEVVVAAVAVSTADADAPGDEQRLHHRAAGPCRRPPPIDGMTVLAEGRGREWSIGLEPTKDGLGDVGLLGQDVVVVVGGAALPGDPVMGQLVHREQVEALVVELDQPPIRAVQPLLAPIAPVASDPCVEDEVVVTGTGHFEGIELEEAEPLDGSQHRLRLRRQCARGREKVARDQEPACVVATDLKIWH